MAVKFEFTLEDDEAERFFGLFQDEKVRMMDKMLHLEFDSAKDDSKKRKNDSEREWYKGHLEWLMSIREKVVKGQLRVDK